MLGVVILHYNEKTVPDTIKCVRSISRVCADTNFFICIVENGSQDSSSSLLHREFNDSENIKILDSDKNMGFARGNNLGYLWLKKNKAVGYIMILNNDTILVRKNIHKVLEEEFHKSNFDILGPQIIARDGSSQNPQPSLIVDLEGLERFYAKTLRKKEAFEKISIPEFRKLKRKNLFKTMFKTALCKSVIFRFCIDIVRNRKGERPLKFSRRIEDVGLHGAALVFSKKYIDFNDTAFCPETFLYKEEDLLYLRAIHENLKLVYSPGIVIKHKEDSSTDSVHGTSADSEVFKLNETIKSLGILREHIIFYSENHG